MQRLVAKVQSRQSELNNVEVKATRGGRPKRLFESLSAFANRNGGAPIPDIMREVKPFLGRKP